MLISEKELLSKGTARIREELSGSMKAEEISREISGACLSIFRGKITGSVTDDKKTIQMYHAYEDVSKTLALLYERLEEWHSLYDQFSNDKKEKLVRKIISEGGELTGFAEMIIEMEKEKASMERQLAEDAKEIMPNFSSIVEPLMAARFLAMAGGMEKLAKMTSSSIQLLGAEKALFRHLKDRREKPPKFGIIYMTRYVQSAEPDKRGKAARLLSASLMKAARIDFYSKRRDDSLLDELKKKAEELK